MARSTKREPTSPELVRGWLENIRAARLSGGAASGKRGEAEVELRDAEADLERCRRDRLTGSGDPKEEKAVLERVGAIRMRLVSAATDADSAATLVRELNDRIHQERLRNPEPFFAEADEGLPALIEARDALLPLLEAYRAQWVALEGGWTTLAATVRNHTEARENARGVLRDGGTVNRDARPRPCPISAKLIDEVRAVTPRPPALASDYYERLGGAIERAMAADD